MENNYQIPQSPYDIRDYSIKPQTDFPEQFALNLVPVKDQGQQSTCVAHALASIIEWHYQRQHNEYQKFSTEFIYGLREDSYIGDGMVIRDALKMIQKYGDVPYTDCKGNHNYKTAMEVVTANFDTLKEKAYPHRISSYFKINSNEELKTALMEYGVVAVSMNTYDDSKLVKDVYTYNENKDHGRHCVFIYGWNEKGWLVQNSWGILYGGDGRFILPYSFKLNEMWGIVDNLTEEKLIKPKRNAWLDIIYKIINAFVNVFKK